MFTVKIAWFSFSCVILVTLCFASSALTKNNAPQIKFATSFFTPKDLAASRSSSASNISLKNTGNSSTVAYGIYVRQYAYVTPGQSCDSAVVMYPASNNVTAGSLVSPVRISANGEALIGANYLYNMLYNANYYIGIITPVSPPGCALPGCTWGSDTTVYNWCIYLGALGPVSVTAGYTANVVPASEAASGTGFDYNLVKNHHYIGPISCNDQTLTCTSATAQSQSF